MKKLKIFILSHKVIFIIFLCLLAVGGYFGYQKIKPTEAAIRYVSEAAKKGILISSVSGTGQVSASNQVEIKPKATGVITGLYAKNSQEFKEGGLIAQIDSRTAASKVSEAKASLDNAKLDLETLLAPADPYTLLQAENSLSDAQDSLAKLKINQTNNYQTALDDKSKAENDLAKSYEDAYNSVASTFLDLPDTISGLYSILFSTEVSDSEVLLTSNSNNDALASTFASADYQKRSVYESYADTADTYYRAAKTAYDNTYDSYKVTDRYSTKTDIENLLADTLETVKKMTDAIKSEINMFDFWIEYRTNKNLSIFTKVSDYQSNLSSYTSKINSHLSELITRQRTIEDYKQVILSASKDLADMKVNSPLDLAAAERSLKEKEQKLADLKAGPTELDIKNKELSIQQKQNTLYSAQEDLANYYIRAPFAGILVDLGISRGDTVTSATVVGTLITKQKIAEVTLNEIDAASVKVGQKATLEFDAIKDLKVTGQVVEVDDIGAVNQGVVSYGVKIAFDVQDDRVKPGMSVSVSIITETKPDVLLIPIAAVKTTGNSSYVEILDNNLPVRKAVTVGSSNDTLMEITSGLNEEDKVITQTTSNGAAAQSASQGQTQGGNNMGGMFRMLH